MNERPNILLITTDHWAAAYLGVAGHPSIQTPTLDSMARSGTRFTNCYSECPVCVPARRTLMTGTTTRTHGDRIFQDMLPMPDLPTMAQTFRDAGYQAYGVGKLHVYPQRDRIGFDDVILDEEGRTQYGVFDDYEQFLGDKGYVGQQFDHGMSNNQYTMRPWHLPEETHATNWATQQMVRVIKRRSPLRPNFWYLSYRHPHPPLVPLQAYLDLYRDIEIDTPPVGSWAIDSKPLPYCLASGFSADENLTDIQARQARTAFYALCTHIDHQIRILIGTLREEGLLDNTIICFTSDHGDMLGNHRLWAKRLFYERSTNVPMIFMGRRNEPRIGVNVVSDRLVGWQDVMPTLLDLAGIDVPESVEGMSMFGEAQREWLYGEVSEDATATRMIRDKHYKLIYYPVGNCRQLFDLRTDPDEMTDLVAHPAYAETLARLTDSLVGELYGSDLEWIRDGELVGRPNQAYQPQPNRTLSSQRGVHWPPPPKNDMRQFEWVY